MKGEIHNQNSLRWHGTQRRIGITGGIASGKSSVGKFLKEVKGFPILDADVYAEEALAPKRKLIRENKNYSKKIWGCHPRSP